MAIPDRLERDGERLVAELHERGFVAAFLVCDVSREAMVEDCNGKAAGRCGRLDSLVNNAGIAGASKPTHEVSEQEWDAVQAFNVKGVVFGVKHAMPLLHRSGGGSIITLSAIRRGFCSGRSAVSCIKVCRSFDDENRRIAVRQRSDPSVFHPSRLHLETRGTGISASLRSGPRRSHGSG